MVTPYFSSIRQTLVNAMTHATESIDIAVAWFTNEELFEVLLRKLGDGIRVRLVLINDDINHGGGLDFQRFIDMGGLLYFGKTGYFMHNKYCIVDGKSVFTGSYNYTYFAEHTNFENIVCIADEVSAVTDYIKNFERILGVSDEATDLDVFLKEHPFAVNTHATRQMRNRDLYQKANEFYEQNDTARAEEAIKGMIPSEEMKSFVIRDVLYKQWQPGYCIRQVTVSDSSVKIDIEVDAYSPAIFLYGPGLDKTWHIKSSSGIVFASAVTDVKLNGSTLLDRLETNTSYRYSEADYRPFNVRGDWGKTMDGRWAITESRTKPKNARALSCTITFPKGDYINEIIDLYEGNDEDIHEKAYWHFLGVNLTLNREALQLDSHIIE